LEIINEFDKNFRSRQTSYKMVTVLSLLEVCDNEGKAPINKVVEKFKSFYLRRLEAGKKVEKEDKKIFKITELSLEEIKNILLDNPVHYLREKGLLTYDKHNRELSFNQELIDFSETQTLNELRRVAYRHLFDYYKDLGGLQITIDELKGLPPEYPATANDIALLSGHNRVKGIHPIESNGFKAVVVLCTLGGENYPNQWLDEEENVLKYYAEARTDEDGVKKFNLETKSNKSIINSKEEGVPLYVFVRRKKGELFHFSGEFEFQKTEKDENGNIYFLLNKKNGGVKSMGLPEVSADKIIEALKIFDEEYRNLENWWGWMDSPQQKFALEYEGKYYPPKMIISLATGISRDNFSGGKQSNNYLQNIGFKIVELDKQENNYEVEEIIEDMEKYIESKGFIFEPNFIRNFFLSLKSKPLVMLAGISGTGKSKLVELFANGLGATRENQRFTIIPVQPDWNDSADLLGYLNLQNEFIRGPLTEVLEKAINDPDYPYIVCLDEMNLARVEYYFSDFLSIMESRRWEGVSISSAPINLKGYSSESELYFPANLYVVGTVNMDETTHTFSRKVLDRANTIELSHVQLSKLPNKETSEHQISVNIENSFLANEYLTLLDCVEGNEDFLKRKVSILEEINEILEPVGLHVGYRVRDEFCFFLLYNQRFSLLHENDAVDLQILQKILPRIQGSSFSIEEVLDKLIDFCGNDYKLSRKKAEFMRGRYSNDGFTSFWA